MIMWDGNKAVNNLEKHCDFGNRPSLFQKRPI